MVSSTGNFVPDSNLNDIKKLNKKITEISDNLIFATAVGSIPSTFSNQGQRNAAHGVLSGTEVIQPLVHNITDVDSNGVSTGVFDKINLQSSDVLVDRSGFTALTLKHIQRSNNDGQRIGALSPVVGKTLTLQAGGDFAILSDIVLTDQDMAYLVYSKNIPNQYRVITSKSNSGTILWSNVTIDVTKNMLGFGLTNLDLITFDNSDGKLRQINGSVGLGMTFDLGTLATPVVGEGYFVKMNGGTILQISSTQIIPSKDIIPQIANLNLGGGNVLNQWLNVYAVNLVLDVSSQYTIFKDGSTANMDFAVPTGAGYQWAWNGLVKMYVDNNFNFHAPVVIGDSFLGIGNSGLDPVANGEFTLNGSDVKVMSGGIVRNLSNIISAANQSLSNLTATSINQDLIPQANKNLGSAANFWTAGFIQTLTVGVANNIIGHDVSNNMVLTVPTGKQITLDINSIPEFSFVHNLLSAPLADFQPFSLTMQGGFIFLLETGNPVAGNGQMGIHSGDVKVISGGATRNLSLLPATGAADIALDNLSTTSINQNLLPQSNKNLGGSVNFWNSSFVQLMFIGNNSNQIGIDISANMVLQVPNAKSIVLQFASGNNFTFVNNLLSAPTSDFQPFSVTMQGGFLFLLESGNPIAGNGQIGIHSGDIKAISGGFTKNFTQMPQLNNNNTFTAIQHFQVAVANISNAIDILANGVLANNQFIGITIGNTAAPNNGFGLVYVHHSSSSLRYLAIGPTELAVGAGCMNFHANNLVQFVIQTTGVGTPAAGSNCPAVDTSKPYTWWKVLTADNKVGFIAVYV